MSENLSGTDVAIVGMAGRFPGAKDLGEFWRNLCAGVESIRPLTDEEALAAGASPAALKDPHFLKVAARLEDVAGFDSRFFGYSPREAELMDPQQRLFLECVLEALEDAGHGAPDPDTLVGVFGGQALSTYLVLNLLRNPDVLRTADPLQLNLGNAGSFLTTRASYKLDLRGPSVDVESACSTSLVAVHFACQSLLNQECDLALAGGVSINLGIQAGYRYVEGGILSPDGHCRPFDADGRGIVFGSGAAVVALRRLEDALASGDTIYAVIKGSAVNNDGAVRAGYTAPSVEGQAGVISEALGSAGVSAGSIQYVETHGTGTPLGDPIELQALTQAFGDEARGPRTCAIGSLKANIGHLDAAAGAAGLIKAALALKHGKLPPSLNLRTPNPHIAWDSIPFYVNTALRDWKAEGGSPRRAGVSSFGMGGTNAHVVLEEPPAPRPAAARRSSRPRLLVLSARTPTALAAQSERLAAHLREHPGLDLDDVAYTLQVGRRRHPHRQVLVCRDTADALEALSRPQGPRLLTESQDAVERPVVFLFPGQGSQHVDMGRALYDSEPAFRSEVDRCAELLKRHLGGLDLRTVLYPAPAQAEECGKKLAQTALTQPALFVLEYATARLWMSWGVKPQAMLGHSIGEYVASCLAGVLTLEHALQLVAARGRLMQGLPSGAMLAVPLTEDEVQPYLRAAGDALSLAALNSPKQCVLSGTHAAVEAVQKQLKDTGVDSHVLVTSHAFHSPMMDPILDAFTAQVASVPLKAPTLPFVSNVTGTWITAEQATSPRYWAQHLRGAVRFADGLRTLFSDPKHVLLEVGPGQVLGRLAKRHPEYTPARAVLASMPPPQAGAAEAAPPLVYETLGRLWQAGVTVDWEGFHGTARRRVPLPTYPFERQRFWVEPAAHAHLAVSGPPAVAADSREVSDPGAWFHVASWTRAPLPLAGARAVSRRVWLVFEDELGVGEALMAPAPGEARVVVRVRPGPGFARTGPGTFTLSPGSAGDYGALLSALKEQSLLPDAVLHLWSLTSGVPDSFAQAQPLGQLGLVFLARALATHAAGRPCALWVVSNHLHDVTGSEPLAPEKATLLGACRVIPQEQPALVCRSVDVVPPQGGAAPSEDWLRALRAEVRAEAPDTVVALRGHHRWVTSLAPLALPEVPAPHPVLRDGGVYLLVGGLEGAGALHALGLARAAKAKLACMEAVDLPERAHWDAHLAGHPATEPVSRRILRAKALEALGAEVLLVRGDLSSLEGVRAAVDTVVARFGALHGVVYAPSVAPERIGQLAPREAPEEGALRLGQEARGLAMLDTVLGDRPLDFRVAVSSLSAVLGGVGQVNPAAMSHYLEAFAHARFREGRRWLSLGWDELDLEGQGASAEAGPKKYAITEAQGTEVFLRALAFAPGASGAVVTHDLPGRMVRGMTPREAASPAVAGQGSEAAGTRPSQPRPQLRNAYLAPGTPLERSLVELWQETLGVAPIGVLDNFFELGGDLPTAVQLSDRIKKRLGVELSALNLYDGVTVQALTALLKPASPGRAEQEARDAGAALEHRKQALGRQRTLRRAGEEEL